MDCITERAGNTVIATPTGRLDADNAIEFKHDISAAAAPPCKNLILNLEQLSYISSAGLRIIAILVSESKKQGCNFSICSPSNPVAYILNMSGFQNLLPIHPTLKDAEEAVKDDDAND